MSIIYEIRYCNYLLHLQRLKALVEVMQNHGYVTLVTQLEGDASEERSSPAILQPHHLREKKNLFLLCQFVWRIRERDPRSLLT